MRELPERNIADLLTERDSSTLWIVAPNYEARSHSQVVSVADRLLPPVWNGRLLVLQFSAQPPVAALETLKANTMTQVNRVFPLGGRNRIDHRVSYPEVRKRDLEKRIRSAVASLTKPYRIVLDITSVPRRVILLLHEALATLGERELFVTYTWAERYPGGPRPLAAGSLEAVMEDSELSELLGESHSSKISLLVFPGRQGSDSGQLIDVAGSRQAEIAVASFFDSRDPLLSLESMRTNSTLLHRYNANVAHYFNFEQATEVLERWAQGRREASADLLLVAPFGPKPLVTLCWTTMSRIAKESESALRWDLVLVRQSEPNSLYSIGSRRTTVFQV